MLKQLSPGKWDFSSAAHLLNRAGFGGPPAAVERLADLGLERAVAYLVDYEKIQDSTPDPSWARPDPERMERLLALRRAPEEQRRKMQREERRLQRQRLVELRGWWLHRMTKGPRPFQEKMTLFWHGHFATSVVKVRDAYYMWRQNELFRRLATGNWLKLIAEVARDPAMLIWLDQAQSRKQHPNENFAREVMELFTLGEGHYTEKDVTEGARCLTGWSLDRRAQKFVYRRLFHDEGIKTFLGRTGNLDATDVFEQILAQPQAAVFITGKLWNFFAGEMPAPKLNAALADEFREAGSDFKPLMRRLLLSEDFYGPRIVRNQVKSPVQWLVSSARMLECELPPPIVCGNLIGNLGQNLFAPPNVKGWDGGLAWITTNTLLARYNEATVLVDGTLLPVQRNADAANRNRRNGKEQRRTRKRVRVGGVQVQKILGEGERTDRSALVSALERRLLQAKLSSGQEAALRQYLDAKGKLNENDIRGAIRLVMSTPEFQVT